MPSFEVLLPLGAVGLYLFDATLWLYWNEALFLRRRRGWAFTEGSSLLLWGRRLCLPNPLAPQVPQFRVRWSDRDHRIETEDPEALRRFTTALRPVQYLVLTLLLLLLALPVVLLVFGTGIPLLVLFAAFYLVILTALGCIHLRRRDLHVSGKAFLSLSLDSLACAPFAINLVRKLSMRRELAGNPIRFASRAFEPPAFAGLVRTVCDRIVQEQQGEERETPRWSELEDYRRQLQEMVTCQSSS